MNGVGFVAACMAACLAAGMGLAVGLERTMTPPSLSDSSDAGNLALGSEEFDDVRSLNVDVTASPAGGVAFPVSGRVTFASCPADGVVRSGSREYDVDGTPLVSLHTDTPLYRDLAYGDKGDDVTALQVELAALGYGGSRSGVFDWATWDAWRRLYAANAGTATAAARVQQGAFSRALAVWLPAQTMSVSCAASLGSTVTGDSTDSPAFRSLAGVASVKAASLPDGRIQGDRVVEINGRDYPIGDDGIVSDTAALQAMAGWSTYTGARKDGEDITSVNVTYKLKKAGERVLGASVRAHRAQGQRRMRSGDRRHKRQGARGRQLIGPHAGHDRRQGAREHQGRSGTGGMRCALTSTTSATGTPTVRSCSTI